MPRYLIHNPTNSAVQLPSPLQGSVGPHKNLTLDTHAVYVDTPAMQKLIKAGLLRVSSPVVETVTIANQIEIPVVDMLGSGSGTGNLSFKGQWQVADPYAQYDVVQFAGQSWVALSANSGVTPVLGSPFWTPLSESMVWRGAWSPTTQYYTNDVVSYLGGKWLGLVASLGVAPTESATWTGFGSGGTGGILLQDDGTPVGGSFTTLNFDGEYNSIVDAGGGVAQVTANAVPPLPTEEGSILMSTDGTSYEWARPLVKEPDSDVSLLFNEDDVILVKGT
jgi:hypothetical protein